MTVRPTGLWLGEAVHFVKKVEAAGFQVDYVSPRGGYTPIDPHRGSTRKPTRRGRRLPSWIAVSSADRIRLRVGRLPTC